MHSSRNSDDDNNSNDDENDNHSCKTPLVLVAYIAFIFSNAVSRRYATGFGSSKSNWVDSIRVLDPTPCNDMKI